MPAPLTNATLCGFCKNPTSLAIQEHDLLGGFGQIVLLRCRQCGAVVAALDKIPTGELLDEIEKIKAHLGIQ